MLVSMRQLLDHAAENGYGLPAFNGNSREQMRAIREAADEPGSPVIVQASAGARKYAGAPFLRHLIVAAIEEFPHIPVCMHQDHGTSPAVCQRSIQLGFSSVMMDGSLGEDGKTPTTYDYNVAGARRVPFGWGGARRGGRGKKPRLYESIMAWMQKPQKKAPRAGAGSTSSARLEAQPADETVGPYARRGLSNAAR